MTSAGTASRRPYRLLLVAAAGYGKTAAAEADLPAGGVRRSAAELLRPGAPASGPLLVEDLHELPAVDRLEVLRRVAALPGNIPVTLTSREPTGRTGRGILRGQVFERGPADLALSAATIARVLADEYGVTDPEAPVRVHALTRGWPALVHFAADALARRPGDDLADALTRPGSAAASWLEAEVIGALPEEARELLAGIADLDPVSADLAGHVAAAAGMAAGHGSFEHLRCLGLVVPHATLDLLGREGYTVVPAVAGVVANTTTADDEGTLHLRSAAEWYDANGFPFAAAHAHLRSGNAARAEALVVAHGPHMIAGGDAARVVELLEFAGFAGQGGGRSVPPGARRTYAEALHLSGDSVAAQRVYAPLVAAADRDGWDPGLAYRVAAVRQALGTLPEAERILDLVPAGSLTAEPEAVICRAWRVNVLSMLGREAEASNLAAEALALAEHTGDLPSLAAAHQAAAKTSSGSRKRTHLAMGLTAARQAGDVVSLARILVNQAYLLLASGHFADAVAVSREAVRATEIARPTVCLIAALHNLAEALTRVGDYAEARWHLNRAVAISRNLGGNRNAAALAGIGDTHRAVGNQEQARAAYEEAVVIARASSELQVLVPALSGLARLLAEASAADAAAAAEEAHRVATPTLASFALTALGWVALARGDRADAARRAGQSVAAARDCQALDLLADALELAAAAGDDPDAARVPLREALSIWREGGAGPDADRIEVSLGRLDGADSTDRSRAREAAGRLQRLGVTRINGRPFGADASGKAVAVRVLGGFAVVVDGQPVPLPAWRSRQARTLVKILAGHRGRPASRSHLCELLWPDDDPVKTAHRLSVLLATVRGVLDPSRAWRVEHYIAADTTGIWLDLRHLSLDAESLLVDARHAAGLLAAGDTDPAREILSDIDARYGGDAFEDEPYEDWAAGLREETRAAWLRSLRHLATLATREGRTNDACALLVRLLAADPYDERIHRGLVRALVGSGRHGEARRAFNRWTEAMAAVDAPLPDVALLSPARGRGVSVLTPH